MLFTGNIYSKISNRSALIEVVTSSLSLGKNLSVGKLCILMSSSSLAVESILAITRSSLSLYFSPSSSQMGASCLQCPHHGASVPELKDAIISQAHLSLSQSWIDNEDKKSERWS